MTYPVSTLVNSPASDDPRCIEPITEGAVPTKHVPEACNRLQSTWRAIANTPVEMARGLVLAVVLAKVIGWLHGGMEHRG